jgi:hypothetical protein
MLALQNKKLIQVARKSASELIAQDPELKNYPDLANYVADIRAQLHLE